MKSLAVQAKAITGGLTAAIGAAAAVVTALNVHAAWVPVLIAAATALGVYGGVHRVPNRPPPAGGDVPGGLVKFTGDVSPEVVGAVKKALDALQRPLGGYSGGKPLSEMPPPPTNVPSVSVPPKPPATGSKP